MKKMFIASLAFVMLIALMTLAAPKSMAQKPTKEDRSVKIEGATPENPVLSLGKSLDKKSGKEVEGYAIVHFAKDSENFSKPVKPAPNPEPSACYGFLAEGAKWKLLEPWKMDNLNTGGINPDTEFSILDASIKRWEFAANGIDILGTGTQGAVSNPKTIGKLIDSKNEVTFAPIRSRGAIAVTYIWGNFSDPISGNRYLAEWDQIYNTAFSWSSSGEAGKMDFDNIATHELGHSVGMGDLYTSSCSAQTMYGYADYGEIIKRDLNVGDIAGINLLY